MKYADILKYVQAGNPSCSPELLEALARDKVDRIRLRVAENPGTPIDHFGTTLPQTKMLMCGLPWAPIHRRHRI